jgi:NAD-dependent oxidoreductase involved in siderophore biosynthesis
VAGLEIQEENLQRILANGNQRQRALAALYGLVKDYG